MGRGIIKSNLGEGQYKVEISLDQSAKVKLLDALELKIEAANLVVENLKKEIEDFVVETEEPDPELEEDPTIEENEDHPDNDPKEEDPEYDIEDPPETGTSSISGTVEA